MAQRLSRWILLTVLGAVIVAVMFLTTGGTPLIFQGAASDALNALDGRDHSALTLRIQGTRSALDRARYLRRTAELQAAVQGALAHSAADPVVLRWNGTRLETAPAAAALIAPIWEGLPTRHPEIRTVVIVGTIDGEPFDFGASLDSSGVCRYHMSSYRWTGEPKDLPRSVRANAGWCLFAEQFGAPGSGITAWGRGVVTSGVSWDRTSPRYAWMYRSDDPVWTTPAWFESGRSRSPAAAYGGFLWTANEREELACLVGRESRCGAASGVTAAGWPVTDGRFAYYYRGHFPHSTLQGELLRSLGPERFGEIWRAETPVAEAYARVTGTSMDPWLQAWAQRWLGRVERDNGLSLLGGIGAFTWLVLLALLTTQRLRQRSVT